MRPALLTRVRLSRYRSIASCDVEPGPLTILVGPNGSGKSNFLDALSLVTEALDTSLAHALKVRGGFGRVLYQPAEPDDELVIALEFRVPGRLGRYHLSLGNGARDNGWRVTREECVVFGEVGSEPMGFFEVEKGMVIKSSFDQPPVADDGGLYLTRVSSISEFGGVARALARMRFFDFHLSDMERLAERDPASPLAHDGHNLPAVMQRLQHDAPETLERVTEYLRVFQPNLENIEVTSIDDFVTIDFVLRVGSSTHRFPLTSMSDGTLNVLAVLVAVFHSTSGLEGTPLLVAIEEPEKTLHPAVVTVLTDAFLEASRNVQVLVTTHSPDLLEHDELQPEMLVAVAAEDGVTWLGPVDEFARSVLRDRLTTPGDLQRQNQIRPERSAAARS